MELTPASSKCAKNSPLMLSVLRSPSKTLLKPLTSISGEFSLFWHGSKKQTLAAYKIYIPKTKLLSNLEIYEWRFNTEFPIVKTLFVHVEPNPLNSSGAVEVIAYNEHCPLKLTQIHEMTLSQSLYLLKESLIGFERLYSRFGAFDINDSMITLNEKGCCRVWINENFGLNSFAKKELQEEKLVRKLITVIQAHTQESKNTKKLFNSILESMSFINALKTIDLFVKEMKILLPTRFGFFSSMKEIPHGDKEMPRGEIHKHQKNTSNLINSINFENTSTLEGSIRSEENSKLLNRLSIKEEKLRRNAETMREEFQKSCRVQKQSSSPLHIKRLKSEENLKGAESMKVSDGETAHTGKMNRTSNINIEANNLSPQVQLKQSSNYSPKKTRKWLEESSYIMTGSESPSTVTENPAFKGYQNKGHKKELSYSEAFRFDQKSQHELDNERKYSWKMSPSKNKNKFYEHLGKGVVGGTYFNEFSSVLGIDDEQTYSAKEVTSSSSKGVASSSTKGATCSLKTVGGANENERLCSSKIVEVDEERFLEEHSGQILKNNGWVSKVAGLMDVPTQLEESFHEGHEENFTQPEIKLEKLSKIGRKEMHTSILPDEIEQLF